MLSTKGYVPRRESLPKVGLIPHTPHKDAGTRIEPFVSEPSDSGTMPAATAAADPPEDPPDMQVKSCGLAQAP